MNPCKPVPPEYIGLWRREGIEINGEWDTDTRVYWLQTGSLYADIRIPPDRPGFDGVSTLADCTPEQLRWLAGQEGFAGCLHVDGDTCRWERALDYQPPGLPDIGRMRFDAGDALTEEGVLAEYREQWRRVDPGPGRLAVMLSGDRPGLLVAVGDWFLAAVGRKTPLKGVSLRDAGANSLNEHLDFELSLGRIRGGGIPWEIVLSTLPYREGEPLLEADPVLAEERFDGRRPGGRPLTGDIVECTAEFPPVNP